MNDQMQLQARGRVKLELYNKKGEVTFSKEKKNLVVLTANEIVGKVMSDPAKTVKAQQVDKGDTLLAANGDGQYVFNLSRQREAEGSYEVNKGATNADTVIAIPDVTMITELKKVTVDGVDLVLEQDVYVGNADEGKIVFKVAPLNQVKIDFRRTVNAYVEIVNGTEVVKVAGVAYKRGAVPSDADKTYKIDHRTGKVFFATAKSAVEVSYSYKIRYSLGFMGIGGKPATHPSGKPVEFATGDKLRKVLEGEFTGFRQLVQYPAAVSKGEAEIQVLPTKPIAFVEKTQNDIGDAAKDTFDLANTNKVLKLVSVKVDGTDIAASIVDATAGTVKLTAVPALNAAIEIKYQEQLNNDHLVYGLAEGPVLELVAIRHEALDHTVTSYKIDSATKGLEIGKGDVWLLNPTQGILQFSSAPTQGVPVETPGQITVEYRINSGTTVQYVADFPKGVPGPVVQEEPNELLTIAAGVSSYGLKHAITKDLSGNFIVEVRRNGTVLTKDTHYTISSDGKQVSFNTSLVPSDVVAVKYSWLNETHEIYTVGMFTDQLDGDMFNISGIGPVTKDKNTGMRITWSVTY
ncbi:hypothetical protein GZH47_32760 (plasmid) [Paenibacillus rhizovicinus]|uniref:Uncharacterized protein n=1 Tax=Paenibacillus rhizovicinus TaxID=2704463 RepID=A0A6C0PBB6_9BACL|nr:hypothetical protein [Paenibacillus rhizovicinus]QHW35671.1 hypothetical protein GZH47_32760 [Paenibacillus rhizovicinus]